MAKFPNKLIRRRKARGIQIPEWVAQLVDDGEPFLGGRVSAQPAASKQLADPYPDDPIPMRERLVAH